VIDLHAPLLTPWSSIGTYDPLEHVGATPEVAAQRDQLFRWLVGEAIRLEAPWLPYVIAKHGAQCVLALPGLFYVRAYNGVLLEVPEVSARLVLLPWADPEEICH